MLALVFYRPRHRNKSVYTTSVLWVCTLLLVTLFMARSTAAVELNSGNADAGDSVTNFPNVIHKPTVQKSVTFYTSYGYKIGQNWNIPFKLWVSEPSDKARQLLGRGARDTIRDKAGIKKLTDIQKRRYKNRVEGFIADSESREKISIEFHSDTTNEQYLLTDKHGEPKTDRNGNLHGTLVLSAMRAQELLRIQNSKNGWLTFSAVSKGHAGTGRVRLISPTGISVISDIDDTIKDTGITKGLATVLKNTFFETFKQVPCMADLYSSFGRDVAFHYVSGAPWQLYNPLIDFMFEQDGNYPLGSLHMKNVRTNLSEVESYTGIWKLMSKGSKQMTYEQKIGQITQLLKHFPVKQFVLIGDSGERDPEVFAEIRKRFPAHIERIIIRDINNESENNKPRYSEMSIIAGDVDQATGCRALELYKCPLPREYVGLITERLCRSTLSGRP